MGNTHAGGAAESRSVSLDDELTREATAMERKQRSNPKLGMTRRQVLQLGAGVVGQRWGHS